MLDSLATYNADHENLVSKAMKNCGWEGRQLNKQETLEFIDKQIALEKRIIGLVEENTGKLGNVFIKDLLRGIAQDSNKHATLLGSLRAAVEGAAQLITAEQRDSIAQGIQQHMSAEAEAVATYGELVDKSNDERVKTIAAMIRDDEVRHHRLLVDLHKALIEPQTLTEEVLWELLWRDSPWHGAPGT